MTPDLGWRRNERGGGRGRVSSSVLWSWLNVFFLPLHCAAVQRLREHRLDKRCPSKRSRFVELADGFVDGAPEITADADKPKVIVLRLAPDALWAPAGA
jgi:hypothetical protein